MEQKNESKRYSSDPKERAKQLVAEGKIGGAREGSGRPRKRRVSEVINEKIEAHAEEIWSVYLDSISETSSPQIRLQAARDLLEIERKEVEHQRSEDEDLKRMNKDQLINELVGSFNRLVDSGFVPTQVIESEAIEE